MASPSCVVKARYSLTLPRSRLKNALSAPNFSAFQTPEGEGPWGAFPSFTRLCLATIQNAPGAVCGGLMRWGLFGPDWISQHFCRKTNRCSPTADSSSPIVAVMQPAQALLADTLTISQRKRPASRCLLFQPEVRAVFVIVRAVSGEKSLQMSLVQRDHVVKQLTAAAANPALTHSILPCASNRGAHRCDLQRANSAGHFEPVLRVVIEY